MNIFSKIKNVIRGRKYDNVVDSATQFYIKLIHGTNVILKEPEVKENVIKFLEANETQISEIIKHAKTLDLSTLSTLNEVISSCQSRFTDAVVTPAAQQVEKDIEAIREDFGFVKEEEQTTTVI